MSPFPIRKKVLAYLLRKHADESQLLIFTHRDFPEAGVQVPGGGLEENEKPEAGVLREVWEEVGLKDFSHPQFLGIQEYHDMENQRLEHRYYYRLDFQGHSAESYEHVVKGGDEDKGMVFCCKWVRLEEVPELAVGQGFYLAALP